MIELTAESWETEVTGRPDPILVDFWAPWCVPCRKIAPIVQALGERHAGRMAVGKLNIDDHPGPAGRHDVLSIPTVILFKGGQPVARVVGLVKEGKLEAAVTPHL